MLPPLHSGFEQELEFPEPEPKNNLWYPEKNDFSPSDSGNIFILKKNGNPKLSITIHEGKKSSADITQ